MLTAWCWLALFGALAFSDVTRSTSAPGPNAAAGSRSSRLVPAGSRHHRERVAFGRNRPLSLLAGVCAGVVAMTLLGIVGRWVALPVAVGVTALSHRVLVRRPESNVTGIDLRSAALLLDLLGTALDAGAPPEQAIACVADVAVGAGEQASVIPAALRSAAEPLRRVGRLLALGAEPAAAWSELDVVPAYREAAASARRCASSGSRLASSLHRAAAEVRASRHHDSLARAERAGVLSMLPLGLCFLPAFVCLGVVPVILGVAGPALSGVR